MVKQSRKKLRRPKRKSYRKRTSKAYRKMVGGAFTQEETQQLLGLGFSENDIEILSDTGVGLNIIQMSLNQINPSTGASFTPQELIISVQEANNEINNLDMSGISNASDDEHDLDNSNLLDDDSMNTTQESDSQMSNITFNDDYSLNNDSLHLSDLENSINNSTNTTSEDNSFGGRKKSKKTRKGRKVLKHGRKSRKQRGGMCFGNGVGSNNYDPNFSIYNTRELTLFPYRPTN
jgi:hypothetical protein